MASVQHVEHGDGSHSIGVELDGVYVPFAKVAAHTVAHQVERVTDLREKASAGDESAQEALDAYEPAKGKSASGSSGKAGG